MVLYKALLIGINYKGTRLELKGCANDASNLAAHVKTLQPDVEIRILSDDLECFGLPTRQNILDGIEWLVQDACEKSKLWFSYSGHGSWTADLNGDESDKRDESIVPLDYDEVGDIIDDELREKLVMPLPEGASLFAILDCCHSGTGLDLGIIHEDTSQRVSHHHSSREYVREEWQHKTSRCVHSQYCPTKADVIAVSGCRDDQTSADACINNKYTGALTHAFLKFVCPERSYLGLLQDMSVWLRLHKYSQRPKMSFGKSDEDAKTKLYCPL
jgi:metacaspase-1